MRINIYIYSILYIYIYIYILYIYSEVKVGVSGSKYSSEYMNRWTIDSYDLFIVLGVYFG